MSLGLGIYRYFYNAIDGTVEVTLTSCFRPETGKQSLSSRMLFKQILTPQLIKTQQDTTNKTYFR